MLVYFCTAFSKLMRCRFPRCSLQSMGCNLFLCYSEDSQLDESKLKSIQRLDVEEYVRTEASSLPYYWPEYGASAVGFSLIPDLIMQNMM